MTALVLFALFTLPSQVSTSSATTSSVAIARTSSVAVEHGALVWNEAWPRFRTPEYVATAALVVLNTFGGKIVPIPKKTLWHGGILFDQELRDRAVRLAPETKFRFKVAGDYLFPALTVMPIVFDSLILSLIVHGSFDVAFQTSLISLQSLLSSSILNLLSKRLTARARPNVPDCEAANTGPGDPMCNSGGAIRSFYSGHAGLAATGAGLICVNHEYLDLFGGGWADHLMCAGALAGASFVGISRVINDAHYATDSIAGILVGLGMGVVMPIALHYGDHFSEPGAQIYVAPSVGGDENLLLIGGSF